MLEESTWQTLATDLQVDNPPGEQQWIAVILGSINLGYMEDKRNTSILILRYSNTLNAYERLPYVLESSEIVEISNGMARFGGIELVRRHIRLA